MKTSMPVTVFFIALGQITAYAQTAAAPAPNLPPMSHAAMPAIVANYGKLGLRFESNQGQSDRQVRFLARGNGYTLFLTDSAAVLALNKANSPSMKLGPVPEGKESFKSEGPVRETDVVRMELAGANPGLHVSGSEQLPGVANYFSGNDPSKWRSNIPTYAKVKYTGVYPGVDLLYYGNQRQLEYDFVVAPGADPKPVRLHFAGASKLKLNASGDLTVVAMNGEVAFHKPVIYQTIDGRRQAIDGQFTLRAGNTVGFKIGAYDHTQELVIDPVLAYATYLGGSSEEDYAFAIAVDSSGNAYITGRAASLNFPVTAGAFQTINKTQGDITAFVTKLNATGSALIYSTYLGGTFGEEAMGIAVDREGDAFVVGETGSSDFPVTDGAFQTVNHAPGHGSLEDSNLFITKLNPSGSGLIYSTYLGGSTFSEAGNIALDKSGNAYVTGYTTDGDFPVTPGAFQPKRRGSNGGENFFVSELASSGSSLVYSTYLGGSSNDDCFDRGTDVAVDDLGDAYVTGTACTSDFPVTDGAFQTAPKGAHTYNAVVSKLNRTGTTLVYSTYLGGSAGSTGDSIAVDAEGSAYVGGSTSSTDFPVTPGAYKVTNPDPDFAGFVTKLTPGGSALVYSTYFSAAYGNVAVALDPAGDAYLTGDPWLAVLCPAGSGLLYSSPIAGNSPGNVTIDGFGNAYIVGNASGAPVPVTPGAFQTEDPSTSNTSPFVAKFAFSGGTTTTLTSSENPQGSGETVKFTAHVASAEGHGVPYGTVRFIVDQVVEEQVKLDCHGDASFSTDSLAVGQHTVVAIYLGDHNVDLPSRGSVTQTIYQSGAESQAEVSPTLNFGTVVYGSSAETLPLTVTNMGGAMLTVAPSINGPSYRITSSTCGTEISPGHSCALQVEFAPVRVGSHQDVLTLSTNGPINPTVFLRGVASGVGAALETPLQFGAIATQ